MYACAGGFPGGLDSAAAQQWSHETADASRRMSVDNVPGGNGLPLHLQGEQAVLPAVPESEFWEQPLRLQAKRRQPL